MSNTTRLNAYSTTHRLTRKKFKTSISALPSNYMENGQYHPIDNCLYERSDNIITSKSRLKMTVNRQADKFPTLRIWNGLDEKDDFFECSLVGSKASKAVMTALDTIVFSDVRDGVDWEINSNYEMIKSTIIVKSINSDLDQHVVNNRLFTRLEFKVKYGEKVTFFDNKLKGGIFIKPYEVYDSVGDKLAVNTQVLRDTVIVDVDITEAVFPIYIDPTATLDSGQGDGLGYITNGAIITRTLDPQCIASNPRGQKTVRRCYFEFPLNSSIPRAVHDVTSFILNHEVIIADADEMEHVDLSLGSTPIQPSIVSGAEIAVLNTDIANNNVWKTNTYSSTGPKVVPITSQTAIDSLIKAINDEDSWFAIGTKFTTENLSGKQVNFDRTPDNPTLDIIYTRRRAVVNAS